jgi:hypothetical protein
LYHDLTPKESKAVVVVLNLLDALGNNQVLENKQASFTAINLTKLTFNTMEAQKITWGEYNFVYVSPEIFLNSQLFTQLYFFPEFQNCLSLVVVNEAHLIYQWGMVKSKQGQANKKKNLCSPTSRGSWCILTILWKSGLTTSCSQLSTHITHVSDLSPSGRSSNRKKS